jgi:radical SAM protein with 4Fe4S-binding SPASM domain
MERLARLLKRVGVDYLVIKPYSPHGLSAKKIGLRLRPSGLSNLEKRLLRYAGGNFRVIFRKNAISKIGSSKPYKKCFGPDFATHISASGEVYPCNAFIGKKEFCFGNIYKKAFKDIWFGARRKAVMKLLNKSLDHGLCRDACRLDEINRYLWELKNPVKHANFI